MPKSKNGQRDAHVEVSSTTVAVDRGLYESLLIEAIVCYRLTLPGHWATRCCTRNDPCERYQREGKRLNSYHEALDTLNAAGTERQQ